MRPNQAISLRRGTIHTASRTMVLFILLCPSVRSTNTIGISFNVNPLRHALTVISIWKAYPLDRTRGRSIASSTRLRKHLNPPVRSQMRSPVTHRAYTFAQYDNNKRGIGQLTTVTLPPR